MSALNFQSLLGQLIRFPNESFETIEARLQHPELSEKERKQLRIMADDPLVRKFGKKMSYCRRRDATQILRLSKQFIDENALDLMFYERFEPTRTSTDLVMIGVQFIEFMLSDPFCRNILKSTPDFTEDLLRYDHAKANIVRQVIKNPDTTLPENSLLAHQAFQILDLQFDIPSYDRSFSSKSNDESIPRKPGPKLVKLVFLHSGSPPFYRMFEIDKTIADFLLAQRNDPQLWIAPLPEAYEGMVKVGLCKSLT